MSSAMLLIVYRLALRIILGLLLIILKAGDVETNPGPRLPKYPCGECRRACTDYKGANASSLCEECNTWFHADCIKLSEDMFSCMGRSDLPWECTNCGLPNISATLFDSTIGDCSFDSSASGDVFDRSKRSSTGSCSSSEPGSQSSPAKPSAKANNTGSNLRTLTINFQSLYGKKEEFWSLVDATKPDIIYGCETWLKSDMSKGEIFPPGYNLYRKYRKDGWGGGLLGVHSSLICQQLKIESEVEFVGAKITSGKQTIIIGALYRPLAANSRIHECVKPSHRGNMCFQPRKVIISSVTQRPKANLLNRQFASVFTKDDTSTLPDLGPSTHPPMNGIQITNQGIVKLLKNLNPYKASGPDGVPARHLKETAEEIAPAISLLYQASLDQGSVPSSWKKALVVPIFKKGSRSSPANYRQISLTAILCKLCEHVVHSAIINHRSEQKILSDAQHGFRKRRSCDTQLILTIDDLVKGIEDKGQTDMILLDFAKAFDKVSHRLLLHKLQHYGICGPTLQ
ncbi:uncharacterized protein [Amphiura filiformis]|uniref:uncharacterized protein n=1 Tax=Amphiura filiformis TaxID=82378 RepID=UPI003B21F05F